MTVSYNAEYVESGCRKRVQRGGKDEIQSYSQVESGENMIFSKYIFDLLFHWKDIYYGQMYPKTCFRILISLKEPKKTAKKVDF